MIVQFAGVPLFAPLFAPDKRWMNAIDSLSTAIKIYFVNKSSDFFPKELATNE